MLRAPTFADDAVDIPLKVFIFVIKAFSEMPSCVRYIYFSTSARFFLLNNFVEILFMFCGSFSRFFSDDFFRMTFCSFFLAFFFYLMNFVELVMERHQRPQRPQGLNCLSFTYEHTGRSTLSKLLNDTDS